MMLYQFSQGAISTKHHTDTPFYTQANNDCLIKMFELFQTDNIIDPISLVFPFSRLVNIATWVSDVENSLLKWHKQERSCWPHLLMVNEEGQKNSFYNPLPVQRSKPSTLPSRWVRQSQDLQR